MVLSFIIKHRNLIFKSPTESKTVLPLGLRGSRRLNSGEFITAETNPKAPDSRDDFCNDVKKSIF